MVSRELHLEIQNETSRRCVQLDLTLVLAAFGARGPSKRCGVKAMAVSKDKKSHSKREDSQKTNSNRIQEFTVRWYDSHANPCV